MKEILLQYSAYHIWANQQLLDLISNLPEETVMTEVPSSFVSLHKTILHLLDAESIWWQRMKLQERLTIPSDQFAGNTRLAAQQLQQLDRQWHEWIVGAQEHVLQHVFQYHNSKREIFKQPIYQMLLHLFNHGTYHRGQLVNQLRQLGIAKIPPTDFIIWSRKKAG
jgi:uncharacterized damage-inducible protein DinB